MAIKSISPLAACILKIPKVTLIAADRHSLRFLFSLGDYDCIVTGR
jgi:hypothetical protein